MSRFPLRLSTMWLVGCLCLGGYFAYHGPVQAHRSPVVDAPLSVDKVATDREAAPTIARKRIADVALGDRVAGQNPLRSEVDETLPDPEPATWRTVSLSLTKQDGGGNLQVELLRPIEWLKESDAAVGRSLFLYLPEMGAVGSAEVMAIGPCPQIAAGDGNVVTGRFVHASGGDLVNLKLTGRSGLTGVTANHPYWSADQGRFVPAGELQPGERLNTLDGLATVESVTPRAVDEPVYNLEVHREHVYRVSFFGALVHNACAPRKNTTRIPLHEALGVKARGHVNMNVPSAPNGKSYITYVFKNKTTKRITYVGRASTKGTPKQAMQRRLSSGHDHWEKDTLDWDIVDTQQSLWASEGAEQIFMQSYREMGYTLTNKQEALSFDRLSRIKKSAIKMAQYLLEIYLR